MGGVRATDYEGFISTRAVSGELGELLADELAQPPAMIQAAHQEDCKQISPNDHTVAAAQFIQTGSFVVVLLGPTYLSRSEQDRDCYQTQELLRTMERARHAESSDTDPFRVFFVLLQDRHGAPSKSDYDARLMAEEKNKALVAWVANHKNYIFIRNYTDSTSVEFRTDFRALVGRIRKFVKELRDHRKASAQESKHVSSPTPHQLPPAPSAPRPATTPSNLKQLESKYLGRAAESWSQGVIGDVSARGSDDSAFKFQPGRFVEFSANQHSRDGSHEHTKVTHPISHWLFHAQKLPLLVVGEGGAGKTTALTAAACAFAAQREDRCRKQCLKIAGGEWLATADQELSMNDRVDYVPVVMRCVDVMESMGARSDSQALVSAALGHMRRVAEFGDAEGGVTQADRDAFYEHLKTQAYIFMLDGLDELANESAAEVLFNAGHTLALDLSETGFRIIFTTRDSYPNQFAATRVVLDKPLDSEKLIEQFIARFADNKETERRLLDAANAVRQRGDALNFALHTPLLLNAFCCIASQDGYDPTGRLAEFCKRTIDYLVKRRKLPKLEKAQSDRSRPVEETAREILRRYAYAFVSISVAREGEEETSRRTGVIRQGEEETAAWLRHESAVLGLNTLDTGAAKDVLRELAVRTNLFRLEKDGTYTFDNTTMFWEYLAAEQMTAKGLALQLTDSERLRLPAWRAAIRFAHAITVDNAANGQELEAPLVLLDIARAATEKGAAWSIVKLALQLLAESPPADLLGNRLAPSLLTAAARATEIYHMFKSQWTAALRAEFCDLLFQIGRRDDGEKTCLAVDQLLDVFLHPRRKWIPIAAEGLPEGFQIADSPVLVAEYRRFAKAGPSANDKWWPVPDRTGKSDPRLMVSDPSDGSSAAAKRHDSWVKQMECPGSPVVSVSFHEAVAYCLWLTERLRGKPGGLQMNEVIRLPTDTEWHAVLRWSAKGANYPWGKETLASKRERVNWRGADVDHPSAPGVFGAIGEEGLYDIGSNVSNWSIPGGASAIWPPVVAKFMPVCGGCWFEFKQDAFETDAKPNFEAPTHRGAGIGFRLVRASVST